nr:MAG TPA: hypothetical protein [Caudoviricetes sp.]
MEALHVKIRKCRCYLRSSNANVFNLKGIEHVSHAFCTNLASLNSPTCHRRTKMNGLTNIAVNVIRSEINLTSIFYDPSVGKVIFCIRIENNRDCSLRTAISTLRSKTLCLQCSENLLRQISRDLSQIC